MDPTSRMFAMGAAGAAVAIPDPGGAYEGGFFAGQIDDGGIIYNLVVAPKSTGENSSVQYKTSAAADTNPPSQNEANGSLATATFNDAAHPAFQWASALNINGKTDWYIPAKNELEIIYRNLKPTTTSNNTSSGANSNAVPSATGNYTSGNPAQTTVTAFQTGNSEAFASAVYWSSSEFSSLTGRAWIQSFNNGYQNNGNKGDIQHARAIRRVPAV